MTVFTKTAVDIFAAQDASGAARKVSNQDVQVWGTEVERVIDAAVSGGNLLIYETKAALDVDLNHDANTAALVIGDSIDNDGLYVKQGASGSGSWSRVGNVPGQGFVKATNTNSGDPNAITATTPVAVNETQLILLPIVATNTSETVTVAFNGGSALTVKTIANQAPDVYALKGGSVHLGVIQDTNFRLLSGSTDFINWRGDWADATAYNRLDATKRGGASYIAIADHTSTSDTEPGVGVNWQTVWDTLAEKGDAGVGESLPSVANAMIRRNAANTAYEAVSAGTTGLAVLGAETVAEAWDYLANQSAFNQNQTGFFFEPDGARIHRVADRLMVGDAVAYDGDPLGTGSGSWLWDIGSPNTMGWIEANATFAAVASRGIGVTGAATQTLADGTVIGLVGYANNARVGAGSGDKAWGAYIEAKRGAGAGNTHGIEIDITNLEATSNEIDPYHPHASSTARGISLASGGDPNVNPTTFPADSALTIYSNGSTFDRGIVIADNGLTRDGGATGRAHAIQMAYDHAIEWYEFTTDALALSIVSQISSSAGKQELLFNNSGMSLRNSSGKDLFRINYSATAVNGIGVIPNDTGGSPILAPISVDDTDVGLIVRPKGSANGYLQSGDLAAKIRWSNTGLGFFGAAPVAKPTGVAVTATDIHAALVTLGLISA